MNLTNIIKFLNKILETNSASIWVNDYLNKDTEQGKLFHFCFRAKLIQVYTEQEEDGYPEEYAELSDLGIELVSMKADLDVCVARLTGIEAERQEQITAPVADPRGYAHEDPSIDPYDFAELHNS